MGSLLYTDGSAEESMIYPRKKQIMENEYEEYGENPVGGMMTDYDYHLNTGELPELFDEESVDDFIANLNDWD